MLLYVHSRIAIILMGKRELVALLNLSSWCLVMVERLFLGVPRVCLQFVIVVFPDHTHYFGLDTLTGIFSYLHLKWTVLEQMHRKEIKIKTIRKSDTGQYEICMLVQWLVLVHKCQIHRTEIRQKEFTNY